MKRKIQSFLLLFGMLLISIATTSGIMSQPYPIHTAGISVGGDTTKLQELHKKLNHFAENIRFQYDSTVLPTASIRTLDSIIHLMHEHGEGYQYIIRVHSYENEQSAAYALEYSNSRANAIRTYLINQGIAAERLVAQGMGSSDRKCFDEHEPDCYHKNNRLEMDVRKMVTEDDIEGFSAELTQLASLLHKTRDWKLGIRDHCPK